MKKLLTAFLFFAAPALVSAQKFSPAELSRYGQQAKAVTIIRDNWGVPHIYGQTDADAVFGLMYAQCEDNFQGIERNYLYQLGRQAEVDGAGVLYTDVQLQLIADTADAIKDYKAAAPWFKKLMNAFADGVNYYLYKHPEVKPKVFRHFEPWYALMFTDGSVAATITGGARLKETEVFYSGNGPLTGALKKPSSLTPQQLLDERELGSNGFALSPAKTATGHAMLYLNPHVPFYFRDEVQIVSNEGLNVYGAVTWGQFFIYQGFNQHCGWMHTSSNADVGDLYAEKVTKKDGKWYYEYNGSQRPVTERKLTINVKEGDAVTPHTITGYYTHHGPVMANRDGKWLALRANNRSYNALLESWLITKANNLVEYKKAMDLLSNATNNTVYADDKGNIIFWYGNFMPKRDPKLDWTQPVDGTNPATEWQGLHKLDEIVQVVNPATGWIENCNSTPFTASGSSSPDKTRYPAYMAPDGQNFRGVTAVKLLSDARHVSMDDLIAMGYDKYLSFFDMLIPALTDAYNRADDSTKSKLAEPMRLLQQWDRRSAPNSVANTLGVELGSDVLLAMAAPLSAEAGTYATERLRTTLAGMGDKQLLNLLAQSVNDLQTRYGEWRTAWGDINRYQRPANGVFDDKAPSIPVGQVSSAFGQLPSFVSRTLNTKKRYGYSGNSFIAVVDFGPKLTARSIVTGGNSFNPNSKHFTDQTDGFINGKFKDVLFYKEDVLKHVEKTYHPGE